MRFRLAGVLVQIGLAASVLGAAGPALYPDRDFDSGLGRVNDVTFSADGRLLAAAGERGFGIWDAQTAHSIRPSSGSAAARIAFAGHGNTVAIGDAGGRVTVVDLRSGATREVAKHARRITAVAMTADGRTGASGDAAGGVTLWNADTGVAAPLKGGGHQKDILLVAFNASGTLVSISADMEVVTWNVNGQRPERRGSLRSEVNGRVAMAAAAAADVDVTRLVVGSQVVSEPRGGVFGGGGGPAHPEDLHRDNVLVTYGVGTGIAGDPLRSGDFEAERIALSPAGCFAFLTSFYRNQPRVHVWGLLERGDDLLRADLPERATSIAVDPAGRVLAIASESGRIRTWGISGATVPDCDAYTRKAAPVPVTSAGPRIVAGSETEPLLHDADGTRLAVLKFEATGVDASLGDAVAEMVSGQLSNAPGLVVIERTAVDGVLRELQIQHSGLTTADAVRIGQGLNARKVILGSVRRFGESTYIVQGRLVDVATQQVQGAREVTCDHCGEADLPKAVEALRRMLAR
jgi:TolB-like protein